MEEGGAERPRWLPKATQLVSHGRGRGPGSQHRPHAVSRGLTPPHEKNHVVPTAWQDEALARDGVSRDLPWHRHLPGQKGEREQTL